MIKKSVSSVFALSLCMPAIAGSAYPIYNPTLTPAERAAIHARVDALGGDVGNTVVGDGRYNPLSLLGAILDGGSYDSISRGAGGAAVAATYPFPVNNNAANQNERDRKTAKLTWLVNLARAHGFPVVVQRQADKYVYVEIGDADAPEMIMALSHLDSPTSSVTAAQLERWRGADGALGAKSKYYPNSYHTPYVKDGWIYGAGVQDDSGPTLATMLAAKALMEAGVPRDRRIRIVMGAYEDGGPGTPTAANTASFMNIPYYTANPSFYDNWAYKMLNREEMPIAAYTSDSRFPVIVGNSVASTPNVTMDLSADAGKAFRLVSAVAGVTLRANDPTLKDIVYGSTTQMASRAVFTLDVAGVDAKRRAGFISGVVAAASAQKWLTGLPTDTPKVKADIVGDTIVLEINTGVAMEMPTPHYGRNAIVWGMHLLSQSLAANGVTAANLQLKKAADGIAELFFRGGVEGEAYIGRYMGIPENLLRNADNGAPSLTFALMGGVNTETLTSFYSAGSLNIPMFMRSMHKNAADYDVAVNAVKGAWQGKGFTLGTIAAFSNPTLYMTHDNPLIALQLASYRGTMNHDPLAFSDVYGLLGLTYAQGTTGGTLASNFRNKMNAFGAIIPGNERWWHSANERIKVASAIQMTKMMADGMLEMARYSGPAGAQYMWADIPGLNANRADLDLLDVTIGTYKDASATLQPAQIGAGKRLAAATTFNIPMWNGRGNTTVSDAAYAAGHGAGGVYLPLDDADFLANTFVLPMRLEFKVKRPADLNAAQWNALVGSTGFSNFAFNVLKGGSVTALTTPAGDSASKFFYKRVSATDPNTVYVSVNLAITDAAYQGVSTVTADSKTDFYAVNPAYLASNPDPFPKRGLKQQRGFFVFGDGNKDARFTSPEAIYVTFPTPGDANADGTANCVDLAIAKASFNKRQGQAGFDARADFNKDGAVDIKDWTFITQIVPVPSCSV